MSPDQAVAEMLAKTLKVEGQESAVRLLADALARRYRDGRLAFRAEALVACQSVADYQAGVRCLIGKNAAIMCIVKIRTIPTVN